MGVTSKFSCDFPDCTKKNMKLDKATTINIMIQPNNPENMENQLHVGLVVCPNCLSKAKKAIEKALRL